MSERLYKTVRTDMGSWHDPNFKYEVGKARRATGKTRALCEDGLLHASRRPEHAAQYAKNWPFVLLEVEGNPIAEQSDKVGCRQLKVVSVADLGLCFGPKGTAVVDVLNNVRNARSDQLDSLAAARDAAWDAVGAAARAAVGDDAWAAAWAAARAAAWDAARAAARAAAWAAAWAAARAAVGDDAWAAARAAARAAAWAAAWDAARDAVRAAAVGDLVGQHGYTQAHHDLLMGPYWEVFGR